jgi:hypothetical protein
MHADDHSVDRLLVEAEAGRRTEQTLTAVIEDAREVVARRAHQRQRSIADHVAGRGIRPGLDLDDTRALLDAMDGDRGPA